MNVKPILWKWKTRQDGKNNIRIYISNKGKKKYIATPFYSSPRNFDAKTGKCKRSHPQHARINPELYQLCQEYEKQIIERGDLSRVGEKDRESLMKFLRSYVSDIEKGKTHLKVSSAKNYKSLITRLEGYLINKDLEDLFFQDVNMDFYNDFKRYLFDFCNCGVPGFAKHVKVLKTVLRMGQDAGLHHNEVYKSRLFKRHRKTNSEKVFLSVGEIELLEKLDLSHDKGLDRERDRFLISYYFLMRFEDSRRITKNNFIPGQKKGQQLLKYYQQKTGHLCIVPVSPMAKNILKKRNYDFSGGSNPQSNRDIKTICALAGIGEKIIQGERQGPKWKFVTTHTARRSAATNLALQNVSIKIIADLGGWADIDTLRTYLRASGLDSANVAQNLDFFT